MNTGIVSLIVAALQMNPFIGAVTDAPGHDIHGEGKTFPGATTPFGMVQLSPDAVHAAAVGLWDAAAASIEVKGVAPEAAGTGVMLFHFAPALAAVLAAGAAANALTGRFPRFRLAVQSVSLIAAAPVLLWFGYSGSVGSAWASAAIFGVLKGAFEANSVNSIFDVVAPRYRASAMGYLNVLSGVLGSTAPLVLGWLSQTRGVPGLSFGFGAFGAVLAVAAALGAIALFFTFNADRRRVLK